MRSFIPTLGYGFAFLLTAALSAQDQTLVPERDWTSADGKVLRASLIGFEKGQGQFRSPEGRRFVIPDDRLSLRDQVAVLIARLNSQFEVSHSADINTDFYYSKHIPASRRGDKHYSYIGFGPGRFNMAIALIEPGADMSQFKEIVVRGGNGVPEKIYPLDESSIRRFTRNGKEQVYVRISFVVGQKEDIFNAVEAGLAANVLRFVARGATVPDFVIELDEPEANGLRETMAIYRQASTLIEEGFLKKDLLSNQVPEAGSQAPAATSAIDPLEPFRKGLAQSKYGSLVWGADAVEGVGFIGADVVVRKRDGEIARAPFAEISAEGRKHLFEKRLEAAYGDAKYVSSAGITAFHHPDWDSQRMNYSRSILLTLNPKGEYDLRVFAWAGLNGSAVKEIFIRGDLQETPFLVACRPIDSYQRDRSDGKSNSLVGTYLNDEDSEAALSLLGSSSIQFRIRSEANQDVSVTMQEDELHATLEAIALFRWARDI